MSDLPAPHILALNAYEPGKPEEELRRELGLTEIVKQSMKNPTNEVKKIVASMNPIAYNRIHAQIIQEKIRKSKLRLKY